VTGGATLTIEPGVTLRFATGAGLDISGETSGIVAVGTEDEPISFIGTLAEAGHWEAVTISSNNPANRIEYTQFAHGGSEARCCDSGREAANVLISESGRATLRNNLFAYSGGNGLEVEGRLDAFENNAFLTNNASPVRLYADRIGSLDAASNYLGDPAAPHGDATIEVRNGALTADATWAALNIPLRFRVGVDVDTTALTLSPGVELIFFEDRGLSVGAGGTLIAEGTTERPIRFSGAQQSPGDWTGVLLEANSIGSRLAFVEIAHAGIDAWCCDSSRAAAGLLIDPGAEVSIQDTSFRDNSGYGIHARAGAEITAFARNRFEGNTTAALLVEASSIADLDAASSYAGGNGEDAVRVRGNEVTNAGSWPALDVPYHVISGDIELGAAVTIEPGARFVFGSDLGLWVNAAGTLVAPAGEQSTTFTGAIDQAGYWTGIGVASPTDNRLEGVTIDGAGSDTWCCDSSRRASAVLVEKSSQLTITGSTLTRSGGWGVYGMSGSLSVTESDNTFSENTSGDVSIAE
jgi:hypothetical protein